MRRLSRLRYVVLTTTLLALVAMSAHLVIGQTNRPLINLRNPTISIRQSRGAGRVADLKSQLESGLKARRPVEFRFIADIVRRVQRRELPLKLVLESFHYARRRHPFPFQYFQRAIQIRAARIGVKINLV